MQGPDGTRRQLAGRRAQDEIDGDGVATLPVARPSEDHRNHPPAPVDDRPAALARLDGAAQRDDDARPHAPAVRTRRENRARVAGRPGGGGQRAVPRIPEKGHRARQVGARVHRQRADLEPANAHQRDVVVRVDVDRRRRENLAVRGKSPRALMARDHVRVRRHQAAPDDPARALRPDPAGSPLELEHAPRGGLRPRALEHARVRRGQGLLEPRQQRQRIEAVERLEHPVGRHRVQEPREEDGLADLGAEPERRLVQCQHGEQPADPQRDQPAHDDAADPVERRERRPRGEEGAHRRPERGRGGSEQRGADQRPGEPGDRDPRGVVGQEERRDERAHDRPDDEAAERKGLRGQPAVRPEDGEDGDREQQQNVDDVHPHRVRKSPA